MSSKSSSSSSSKSSNWRALPVNQSTAWGMTYTKCDMSIALADEVGRWDTNLLLDVFTNLVIKLKFLVNLLEVFNLDVGSLESILIGWYGGREEVEEGFSWAGLADETSAVCVYSKLILETWEKRDNQGHTLVALLLDFELLGQIFILLPFDFSADRTIVYKVTRVTDFLLVEISLL